MNIELEMKFSIDDPKVFEAKVLSLGFEFIKEKNQSDYYYSPAHKSFVGTKKYYLRVRQQSDGSAVFAFHDVINDLKTEELEVDISDFVIFSEILKKLDCRLDCLVEKNRKIYRNDNFEITIDQVNDLGSFIELEYAGSEVGDSLVQQYFNELITKLGLNREDLVAGVGYPDLLMDKIKYGRN
jgi:adenylate cyclase class 2